MLIRPVAAGCFAFLTAMGAVSAAEAATGWLSSGTSLRAGPGAQYRVLAAMRRGDEITVNGCIRGYGYCDIVWRGQRGWVRGGAVEISYQSRRGPIAQYAQFMGIPFLSFGVNNNGNERFYRDRSSGRDPRFNDFSPEGRKSDDSLSNRTAPTGPNSNRETPQGPNSNRGGNRCQPGSCDYGSD